MSEGNVTKKPKRYNILNILAICISFVALVISFFGIFLPQYYSSIKNRPYLHVEWENPVTWTYVDPKTSSQEHRKMKAVIVLHNKGNIPATNIDYDWYVGTDKDGKRTGPDEFHKKEYGKVPFPKTLFQDEKVPVGYQPDISPTTKKVYLNVVVSYEGRTRSSFFKYLFGLGSYKRYWYMSKAEYEYMQDVSKKRVALIRTSFETNYDRDEDTIPPRAAPEKGTQVLEQLEK